MEDSGQRGCLRPSAGSPTTSQHKRVSLSLAPSGGRCTRNTFASLGCVLSCVTETPFGSSGCTGCRTPRQLHSPAGTHQCSLQAAIGGNGSTRATVCLKKAVSAAQCTCAGRRPVSPGVGTSSPFSFSIFQRLTSAHFIISDQSSSRLAEIACCNNASPCLWRFIDPRSTETQRLRGFSSHVLRAALLGREDLRVPNLQATCTQTSRQLASRSFLSGKGFPLIEVHPRLRLLVFPQVEFFL